MVRVNITFPRVHFRNTEDYEKIFAQVLAIEKPTKIIKFSTTPHGIDVILDMKEDKVQAIKQAFAGEDVKIQTRGTVTLDKDLCVDCGHCVSLCNVNALYFDEEFAVCFEPERCVGCGLCLDCCPRFAISTRGE